VLPLPEVPLPGEPAVLPSPTTVTWLPDAPTGALAPAAVWFPDPFPLWPLVLPFPAPPVAAPNAVPEPFPEPAFWLPSPITLTWLPEGLTGAVTPGLVWFPDPLPPSPVVF
jgi:hypothetical protein